ncbi:cation:proton antiporter [Candidatus Uhrbacteria bacterium]|nr:cation:proton antiporter [Candidatus Uhrbacteria bacterium]
MDSIFIQISTLLAVTVGAAFLIRLLRQPLIVAYIVAGIICGPYLLNLLRGDQHLYEAFAQFGVVLLLFVIGLNLNLNHLRSIGRISLVTGLGQVIFTFSIGLLILLGLGMQWKSAAYLAVAITFSSTIIIMKLLSDKNDVDTVYGRHTIGLMLAQDMIAVLLIIGLGIVGSGGEGPVAFLRLGLETAAAIVVLALLSRHVLPRVLSSIAGSSELLFLFSLAWCFGVASLLHWFGLSLEVGAVISGIAISSSPFQLEIASRIRPLRDFFLVLFFVVLGSEMGFGNLSHVLVPSVVLSLFILIGNPLILFMLFRRLRFTRRNSLLAGLTAAQVSEFGFILLFAGRNAGHIHGDEVGIFTVVAIVTIFSSSYLITHNERIYRLLLPVFALFGPDRHRQDESPHACYDAWVVGCHRIGRRVVDGLRLMGRSHAVIDFDPNVVKKLQEDGTTCLFGDIADVEFLEGLPLDGARLVVMTIPSVDDQLNMIRHVRGKVSQEMPIVANAYHDHESDALYAAGASLVMRPHLLGGHWIADALVREPWDTGSFVRMRQRLKEELS